MNEIDKSPDHFDYDKFMAEARKAFCPFSPIELIEKFKGREEVQSRFIDQIAADGRHIILYGDRGVGKTSFANVAPFFARRDLNSVVHVSCYSNSNYESIFGEILKNLGHTQAEVSNTSTRKTGVNSGQLPGISAEVSLARHIEKRYEPLVEPKQITPELVVSLIAPTSSTVIIDEYDRISDEQTNEGLAETIKKLSDLRSEAKIVVVGVAKSASELISRHPSLERCCDQIKISRMSRSEMNEILNDAEVNLGLAISKSIADQIIYVSDGFPHFVHLLGLYTCSAFARRMCDTHIPGKNASKRIPFQANPEDVTSAIRESIECAESSLVEKFQNAVSQNNSAEADRIAVLEAIALDNDIEVKIGEVGYNLRLIDRTREFSKHKIQAHVTQLAARTDPPILERIRPGVCKFCDPRMRAYIRLLINRKRPDLLTGQMPLPYPIDDDAESNFSPQQRDLIADLFVRIPSHTAESITYTKEFDVMCEEFNRRTGLDSSQNDIWRQLQNLRKSGRFSERSANTS